MMVIMTDGEANIFIYNKVGRKTAIQPDLMLKNKHVSMIFYSVNKSVASCVMHVGFVKGGENLADFLEKKRYQE